MGLITTAEQLAEAIICDPERVAASLWRIHRFGGQVQHCTVLRQLAGQQFDLIIDDGSHQLAHQQAAVTQLWPLLRVGGVFVIEDIQSQEDASAFAQEGGWTFEDWRDRGRYDDLIAWRTK